MLPGAILWYFGPLSQKRHEALLSVGSVALPFASQREYIIVNHDCEEEARFLDELILSYA